jgi:hypothetical protein
MPTSIAPTKTSALVAPGGRGHEPRPRAEAAEPPAHAENRRAEDEFRVDVLARRDVEAGVEERRGTLAHEAVQYEVHGDRSHHDHGEARIPSAGEVEEAGHLLRARHARDGEADPEEQAARGARGVGR